MYWDECCIMGCMKRGVGVNVRGWTENGNAALGLSWDQEWQVETGGARTLWSPISSMLCHVMCVCMCVCLHVNKCEAIAMFITCTAGNMQQRIGGFEGVLDQRCKIWSVYL